MRLTNTHFTHEQITISGTKTWNHGANTNRQPESIVVHVRSGNEIVASKRVTATDSWRYSFILPKYALDGMLAKYTIEEESVPYYSLVKQDGFNLLNEFKGLNYPGDPPKTGEDSDLALWAGLMGISAALFAVTLVWGGRAKEREKRKTV